MRKPGLFEIGNRPPFRISFLTRHLRPLAWFAIARQVDGAREANECSIPRRLLYRRHDRGGEGHQARAVGRAAAMRNRQFICGGTSASQGANQDTTSKCPEAHKQRSARLRSTCLSAHWLGFRGGIVGFLIISSASRSGRSRNAV